MAAKSTIWRSGILLGMAAVWGILWWARPAWAAVLYSPWVSLNKDFGWWVPAVGGALMLVTMTGVCWPLVFKKRRRGDDAMGLGCLMMFAWGFGVVMVGFGVCVVLRAHFVVNLIGFLMMGLAAFILPQLAWALWKDRRKGRRRGR